MDRVHFEILCVYDVLFLSWKSSLDMAVQCHVICEQNKMYKILKTGILQLGIME